MRCPVIEMTQFRSRIDIALYDRYLAGECSADEVLEVRRALVGDTGGMTDDEMRRVVRREAAGMPAISVDTGWKALQDRGQKAEQRPRAGINTQTVRVKRDGRRALLTVWSRRFDIKIAMFGALAVFAIAYWQFGNQAMTAGATPHTVYRTRPAQTATLRLPDGSLLTLAPATSLVIRSDHVELDGEASFAIAPHTARPFVVQMANAAVTVLGTEFTVRRYASDSGSRIVVDKGRVMLSVRGMKRRGHGDAVLSSRMLGFVTDSQITVTSGITTRAYTEWTRGMLVFNQATLREVTAALSRAYDVDVRVADGSLAEERMRLDVSVSQQSIAQVLDLIGTVTMSHYSKTDRGYLLVPGRSQVHDPSAGQKMRQFPQTEKIYGR